MYFKQITYIINHKYDILNNIVDALSRKEFVAYFYNEIARFECLKELYEWDEDIAGSVWIINMLDIFL